MQDFAAIANVLQEEIGFPEGSLYEGCPLEFANRLWLSKSFGKKFEPKGIAKTLADLACLNLFEENNFKCQSFALAPRNGDEEYVIEAVKGYFDLLLHCGPDTFIDRDEIASRMMVGPGASQGASSYNFYSKLFAGPMTCTSDLLYRVYLDCLKTMPRWLEAEKFRHDTFGTNQVVGNRLSFAPKTSVISRSICTEPNLNMLIQKGIGSCVEAGLKRVFCLDLSNQPTKNRKLARTGSIDGTFGTIDLSSASDSMSLNLLRSLLPLELMKWLEISRSRSFTFPGIGPQELHMVSSMGNGFTFPLQTYLFASITAAAYRCKGVKPYIGRKSDGNFGVFGDDIIVLKDHYDFVIRCLELFGFSVNNEKSFNSGSFRESCGGDFMRGHEIRGVYIRSLDHDADIYSAINRLVRWSARTGILLPKTITSLIGYVRGKILYIPYLDGDAEGIKLPEPPLDLERDRYTGAVKYHALVSRISSFEVPDSPVHETYYPFKNGKRTKVFFNPDGLLVSVTAGFIRCGRISLRKERITFKIRKKMTSSWSSFVTPFDASVRLPMLLSLDQGLQYRRTGRALEDLPPVGFLFSPRNDWEVISRLYFLK